MYMKLLIVTQKVDIDDDVLGFMHGWISEFALNVESIICICLYEGRHNLPENVKVLSLGKERGVSKIKYLWNFYRYILSERRNYDAIFVHMHHIYVVLGGVTWRLCGKVIGMWYAHGHVPRLLPFATKLSHIIFTSTESGFRIVTKKKKVIGQGIDVQKFKGKSSNAKKGKSGVFNIISVGRISPSKDYKTLIWAVKKLIDEGVEIKVTIVGGTILHEDRVYAEKLKALVEQQRLQNKVLFTGPIPNTEIPKYLASANLFVNMGRTGSLDKAILEAMAARVPIITSNVALLEVLRQYKNTLMYKEGDEYGLSQKIKNIIDMSESNRTELGDGLRRIVLEQHSLQEFAKKIIHEYEDLLRS